MVPDSRVRRRRRRREWRFGFLAVDRPATEEVPVAPLPNSWGCPGFSPVSISLIFLCLAIGYYPRVGLRARGKMWGVSIGLGVLLNFSERTPDKAVRPFSPTS